jgi:sporulation protein YlmC with PRC-barrel domain
MDLELARDLLDQQVRDADGEKMGKVDGVVLELREGAPPRVAAIEIGPVTLARRIHPVLGRWARALEVGCGVAHETPLRIPMAKVTEIDVDVKVDLKAKDTTAWEWERWLAEHVVERIPGRRS